MTANREPAGGCEHFPPLRVPVGEEPERWRTYRGERTVVALARTVTSTVRVLDVLRPVLRDDPRVQVVFALDPGSAFNDGVLDLLDGVGARILPWRQLPRLDPPPDLIVTATENADLAAADPGTPVLVLPHGVGFHKYVPDSRTPHERLAGVVPDSLLRSGRVRLAISHPDQAGQLAASHPDSAGLTVLVGDPCHDALLAGRALRDRYRRALGVPDDKRLVMVSSTWREESVLGGDPALPARLLAELPMDEYAVALVTHPNIASAHGHYELRRIMDSAHSGGLLRIPPTSGWQATLLASDLLIGDHGSVTFYGAALGVPLLLGAFSESEAVPGTPMAELGRTAPRLLPGAPLLPQVEKALDGHDADGFRRLGESAFAVPGQAVGLLREAVYGLLRLSPPDSVPLLRQAPEDPLPEHRGDDVTAAVVTTDLTAAPARTGSRGEGGPAATRRVTVSRTPAAVAHFAHSPPQGEELNAGPVSRFRHLSCADDEDDRGLAESASVLVRRAAVRTSGAARRWLAGTLGARPGCLLAAVQVSGGGCLVELRDGRTVEVAATGSVTGSWVPAAVVYAFLRAGLDPEGFVTLGFSGAEEDVLLRLLTPAAPQR